MFAAKLFSGLRGSLSMRARQYARLAAMPPAPLDASKLVIHEAHTLKPIPAPETLRFGETSTDHILTCSYSPVMGWSNPEIKPYGPLALDPMANCLHYATGVFEGMKAYVGPDGMPRLFRPDQNVKRLQNSAARVALPPFDSSELLKLIKRLVVMDARWIPSLPGHSLYIRPTIIGTSPSLGVTASNHATLYVVLNPTGPFFKTGPRPIALLAVDDAPRAWPGGTGAHKLALNYAGGFLPQQEAARKGYDQIVWLLGEENRITEAGAMNIFVVVKRDDGDLDVMTPSLDGTILPGITRASCLELTAAHPSKATLPGISPSTRMHVHERTISINDLSTWTANGQLQEVFLVGTAAVVAPVGRIGYQGRDINFPAHAGGLGPVGRALWDRIGSIQTGRYEWNGWSVPAAEKLSEFVKTTTNAAEATV